MTVKIAPISIVGYEDDANLREISWNQGFLESVKKEWELKHCQAVLFVNKAHDRFRLVVCFYNFTVLMLPPVDQEDRVSLYLKVSQFLKKFTGRFKDATDLLDAEIELSNERIKRRKQLAKSAVKKTKSKTRKAA